MTPSTLRHYAISAAVPRRELGGVEFVRLAGPFDSLPAAQAALPATTVPAHAFGDAFVVEIAGELPLVDAAVWRHREEVMKTGQPNWELDDVPSTFMATPYEFALRYARMLEPGADEPRLRAIRTVLLDGMRRSIRNGKLSLRDSGTHIRIEASQLQLDSPGWFAVYSIDKCDFLAWAKAAGGRLPGEIERSARFEKIAVEWRESRGNTEKKCELFWEMHNGGHTTDAMKAQILGITEQAVSNFHRKHIDSGQASKSTSQTPWVGVAQLFNSPVTKRTQNSTKNH